MLSGSTSRSDPISPHLSPISPIPATALDYGQEFNMKKKHILDIYLRLKNGLGGKMGIKTILALCDRVEYRRKDRYNENSFIILDK